MAGEQPACSKRWIQLTTTLYVLISNINCLDVLIREYQVVVSPRNFFLFTPLLPSVAVGTLNTRSIIQSVRYITRHKTRNVSVIEAEATDVDVCTQFIIPFDSLIHPAKSLSRKPSHSRVSSTRSIIDAGRCMTVNSDNKGTMSSTTIPYDYLVYAVGAETQTFNIPGVKEHACFMKELNDAERVSRSREL